MHNRIFFEQWLVGITDADGTFHISYHKIKWGLAYKIVLSKYNLRILYYIKKQLGFGSVTKGPKTAQFIIRDRKVLEQVILPIFDKYPLLTSKQFNYLKFRKALFILNSIKERQDEIKDRLFLLKCEPIPYDYISSAWQPVDLPLKSAKDVKNIMTKPWLVGFIEAKGNFYFFYYNDSTITAHGFFLRLQLDKIVLDSIRLTLHITTLVRLEWDCNYYELDTTNSRAIENIITYFSNTLKGRKSLEYRIWARSYIKHKQSLKLFLIRNNNRRLEKGLKLPILLY